MVGAALLVTGAITAGAGVVAIAPSRMLRLVFGTEHVDALTRLIARHWGLLVALVGALLLYAAYDPEVRTVVMLVAVAEKLAIGGLILTSRFRAKPWAAIVACADSAMALLYIAILAARGS